MTLLTWATRATVRFLATRRACCQHQLSFLLLFLARRISFYLMFESKYHRWYNVQQPADRLQIMCITIATECNAPAMKLAIFGVSDVIQYTVWVLILLLHGDHYGYSVQLLYDWCKTKYIVAKLIQHAICDEVVFLSYASKQLHCAWRVDGRFRVCLNTANHRKSPQIT